MTDKEEMKARGITSAIERYKARYGDDPNETKCLYPFCGDSGHPAMNGYCSCACEDSHSDMMEIEALELWVAKLLNAIEDHRYYTGFAATKQDVKLWEVLDEYRAQED